MHDTALTEIKALLTLALLKAGTKAQDIQTAIDVAATTRLMAGEESAKFGHEDGSTADDHIADVRDLRHGGAAVAVRECKRHQPISRMNGDVKALLTLLLLQHGATSREILTTLRMAAATRGQDDEQATAQESEQATRQEREQPAFEQPAEAAPTPIPIPRRPPMALKPDMLPTEIRPSTPKQRLRNDYLAPISRSPRAA